MVQSDDVVVHQPLVDLHFLKQRPALHLVSERVLLKSLHREQLASFAITDELHTPIRPLAEKCPFFVAQSRRERSATLSDHLLAELSGDRLLMIGMDWLEISDFKLLERKFGNRKELALLDVGGVFEELPLALREDIIRSEAALEWTVKLVAREPVLLLAVLAAVHYEAALVFAADRESLSLVVAVGVAARSSFLHHLQISYDLILSMSNT